MDFQTSVAFVLIAVLAFPLALRQLLTSDILKDARFLRSACMKNVYEVLRQKELEKSLRHSEKTVTSQTSYFANGTGIAKNY